MATDTARPATDTARQATETGRPATDPTADPELACPVSPVVDIVFSRWTTPILWSLHTFGRQRFVELERRIKGITPKVLTQRLRQLERDGLVVRTYHPEVPPRVEYEISELGRSLAPLFAHLAEWAATHLDHVEAARRRYDASGSPRA
ncbi:winged helix-turn-helix transcriptional regulator [Streptomyces sp. NPDC003374]